MVTKNRGPIKNLANYLFKDYLPSLLWGMIVDKWISAEPLAKCRPEDLNPAEQEIWQAARQGRRQGPLPRYLLEALRSGQFTQNQKESLKRELTDLASDRISEVREEFRDPAGQPRTFVGLWVGGEILKFFPGCQTSGLYQDEGGKLAPLIERDLSRLIDDAVKYIEWCLLWPKFVQAVRSFATQGRFLTDLSFRQLG